jgi:tetratricopeptide (TPR) repeat protein
MTLGNFLMMAEKRVHEIARPTRELYDKGMAAFQRQNFDYAIPLFSQALQQEPGFFECRQALRASQFKKVGQGSGFFKKVLGGASASPHIAKAQMALRKDPTEALIIAEQVLSSDPNNGPAHRIVAEAAKSLGFTKTAILSLEILAKNNSKDREVMCELGDAYAADGQVARAETLYSELLQKFPNDPLIAQSLKNLSAKKTLVEQGYEKLEGGGGSYRDILRNKEEAISLEQEKREVKTDEVADRLLQEHLQRLEAEPASIRLLRTIAELYTQKEDYDSAQEYYNRILSLSEGTDPGIEKALSDLTEKRFDSALSRLDPTAPTYEEERKKILSKKDEFIYNQAKGQVEKYPNDLLLRYELGRIAFRMGKISEAIQELQKAQNHPNKRIQALSLLGQCFAARGMNDLAIKTYQNALKEKLIFDEEKKELIYALGMAYEKMGKAQEAIDQFKQIYEVDIGYRDVAAKVDAFYAGSS